MEIVLREQPNDIDGVAITVEDPMEIEDRKKNEGHVWDVQVTILDMREQLVVALALSSTEARVVALALNAAADRLESL